RCRERGNQNRTRYDIVPNRGFSFPVADGAACGWRPGQGRERRNQRTGLWEAYRWPAGSASGRRFVDGSGLGSFSGIRTLPRPIVVSILEVVHCTQESEITGDQANTPPWQGGVLEFGR